MSERRTVPSSPPNDSTGEAMCHPIDTGDLAADLFAAALRATEAMVFSAARKSMPASRFLPKFELTSWASEDLAICAAKFEEAVDARIDAALRRQLERRTGRRAA